MIFTHKKWEAFCEQLQKNGIQSIPARDVNAASGNYLVLKHDVETDVSSAYRMALIEERYGHKGSYYVQAYLLEKPANVALLQKMQDMGHEVSYHHDVMDSCKGDLENATIEFERNRKNFEENGFPVVTVCQHGNPVVERIGYSSNRDFFRSEKVQAQYPYIADIMVNFPERHQTKYRYFSDAGRVFKWISDPINNDIKPSAEQDIPYQSINALLEGLSREAGNIVSIHPHRWSSSAVKYVVQATVFKTVKGVAKGLLKIPGMEKVLGRFYYLAKKF